MACANGIRVGIAATGILAANLALIDIPVGWIGLSLLAIAFLVAGLRRTSGGLSFRPKFQLLGFRILGFSRCAGIIT